MCISWRGKSVSIWTITINYGAYPEKLYLTDAEYRELIEAVKKGL